MPLSEHEQRLLDQLEQQLNAEDPAFASSMSADAGQPMTSFSVRNLVVGVLVTVLGMGVIIAGVATKLIILGIVGFIIAAGGAYYATVRNQEAKPLPTRDAKTKKQSQFMKNLEDKWDQRSDRGY